MIHSANTPGACDNALNDAVLLEMARVMDAGTVQPPVDDRAKGQWLSTSEKGLAKKINSAQNGEALSPASGLAAENIPS